jgi:hypothetical protein
MEIDGDGDRRRWGSKKMEIEATEMQGSMGTVMEMPSIPLRRCRRRGPAAISL